jgi:hypothetical protein
MDRLADAVSSEHMTATMSGWAVTGVVAGTVTVIVRYRVLRSFGAADPRGRGTNARLDRARQVR